MDDLMREMLWSKFASALRAYVDDYCNPVIPTDYEINIDINIPYGRFVEELQFASSLAELSPETRRLAEAFIPYYTEKTGLQVPK